MNGVVVLIIGVALLACGYIFYGRWLCKQWGVGELKEETPAPVSYTHLTLPTICSV